jgi:hypothetical protein
MNFSNYTVLLKAAIGVVIFIFGAFSGFLLNISPPDPAGNIAFQVGLAQFVALVILLFFSLLSNFQLRRSKKNQRKFLRLWLMIAAALILTFIISSLLYYKNFQDNTIVQKDWNIRFTRGTLTETSRQICAEEKQYHSEAECESFLLYKYYNANEISDKHFLWTEESVSRASLRLLINYIIVIVSLSASLFSLVELLSWKKDKVERK